MKQMKFFLVALMVVLMGVSVTSCLNGDDNHNVQFSDFVRVNTSDYPVSFQTASDIKLVPTQSIATTSKPMALISYQFDSSTVEENAKSINVTLLDNPYYFDEVYVSPSSTETGNAPMITLEPVIYSNGYYGTVKGRFFDKNTLILPLPYKYKKYNTEDEQKIEGNLHSFVVTYDEETGFENGTLTLRLHHQIANNLEVEREANALDYKAFNLSPILERLSGTVTKVNVIIKENPKDDSFAEADAKDKTYTIEYNFK